jgi:hypothetical protein
MSANLVLTDHETLADLETFVQRAKRIDAGGAIRLVAHGAVLAAYVVVLHGVGLPTVLGLRVAQLAEPSDVDLTVELTALTARFARAEAESRVLPLPPAQVVGAGWAGVSPPRGGWEAVGELAAEAVREVARSGIAAVAGADALAAPSARAAAWGAPWAEAGGAPRGLALGAELLGFIPVSDGDQVGSVTVHRNGTWWRGTTGRGHVLARRSLMG